MSTISVNVNLITKRNDSLLNRCYKDFCDKDNECQQYDMHKICEQKKCRCDEDYSENSYDKKCYYSYEFNWLWFLLIIPVLILIIIILMVRKKYFSRFHQSNQDIDSSPTHTEIPLSIIPQDTRFNDPPPAYSTNYMNPCQPIQSNQFSPNRLQNVDDPPPPYSIK